MALVGRDAVLAEALAVVGGDDDDGLVPQARRLERVEHAADVEVGEADLAVVEIDLVVAEFDSGISGCGS